MNYTGFNDQFIDVSVSNNKLAKMKVTIIYFMIENKVVNNLYYRKKKNLILRCILIYETFSTSTIYATLFLL